MAASLRLKLERVSWDLVALALLGAGCFALLLALRGGLLGRFLPYDDELHYGATARALAEGGPYRLPHSGDEPTRFPIGFPAFLTLIYRLAGDPWRAVDWWEIAMAGSTVAFLGLSYWALTRLWAYGRFPSAIAVALVAVAPVTLMVGTTVMSDFPAALLLLGGLCLAELALRAPPAGGGRVGPGVGAVSGAILLGLACTLRMAAAAGMVAVVLAAWRRDRRVALLVGGVAAGVAALGIGFEILAGGRSGGYVTDLGRHIWLMSRQFPEGGLAGLWLRAGWTFVSETLCGAALPPVFLAGLQDLANAYPGHLVFPRHSRLNVLAIALGLALSAGLIGCAWRDRTHESRSLPATYALVTLLVVWAWTGPFLTLGWWLQLRLLLPALPFVLAGALATALAAPGRWRTAGAAALGLLMVVDVGSGARFAQEYGRVGQFLRAHRDEIRQVTGHFADRPELRAGAVYPLQGYFYTGRRFARMRFLDPDLGHARAPRVEAMLIGPHVDPTDTSRDRVIETANALSSADPPRARLSLSTRMGMAVLYFERP